MLAKSIANSSFSVAMPLMTIDIDAANDNRQSDDDKQRMSYNNVVNKNNDGHNCWLMEFTMMLKATIHYLKIKTNILKEICL